MKPIEDRILGQLRFAALRRVSTEQQEDKGESLRVQKEAIEQAVIGLGKIVEWYGGQEHATPGYEKNEINRLLKDAERHRFDAVIIDRTDRWSRDNEQSSIGLKVFRDNSIRFFILANEKDLYDPADEFFINVNVTVGQYFARSITKESRRSKVKRAKDGKPSCGKLPFGRTYNKNTGKWDIDLTAKARIEDAARRYLAGEKLSDVANEYSMDASGLHRILMHRCSDTWEQKFKTLDGKSTEIIETKVPRLLDEATIKAIHKKAQTNKTYNHGEIKNNYLLRRVLFCKHCGYAMFGQTSDGYKYYRHTSKKHANKSAKICERPDKCNNVPADEIEDMVLTYLFEMFGDPKHIQQAIERATPDIEKVKQHRQRLQIIDREIEKIKRGKVRLVDAIYDGLGTEIEKKITTLNEREARLIEERNRLSDNLENVPTPDMIKRASKSVRIGSALRRTKTEAWFKKMPYENKRALLEMVFAGKTPDGKRMGVYIEWKDNGRWHFDIHGHLIERENLRLLSKSRRQARLDDELRDIGSKQKELLTNSTLY